MVRPDPGGFDAHHCSRHSPDGDSAVLFDEMSKELDLNLVQMGWIWGIGFLTGIVTSLIGGALGDRFGAKWWVSGQASVIIRQVTGPAVSSS